MFVFAWKNSDSFRRHMEEMKSFRHAHEHLTPVKPAGQARKAHKALPGNPPCPAQENNAFIPVNGKKLIVPIWYISMPKDSQN
jgi:hypothetical protein